MTAIYGSLLTFHLPMTITAGFLALLLIFVGTGPAEAGAVKRDFSASRDGAGTAFFYGTPLPVDELIQFDSVVVEPAHAKPDDLATLHRHGVTVIAYLSVGEVDRDHQAARDIDPRWVIGRNKAWNSLIMDLRSEDWARYVLERLMAPLMRQGYDGVFLDTLDSYQMAVTSAEGRERQRQGLIGLIQRMRAQFPSAVMLLNRGFDQLARIAPLVDGVVIESLVHRWDAKARRYTTTTPEDQAWLMNKIRMIKETYKLPVTIIDYLPLRDREQAREAARQLADQGLIPWITEPDLTRLGVGLREIVPRKIMVLYDSEESPEGLPYSNAHQLIATPLEYLGYAVEYADIREGLPDHLLSGSYAGLVTFFTDAETPHAARYQNWLFNLVKEGFKVAILGNFGFQPTPPFLRALGLMRHDRLDGPLSLRVQAAALGWEAPVGPILQEPQTLQAVPYALRAPAPPTGCGASPVGERAAAGGCEASSWLELQDAAGRRIDPILIAGWGGLALDPYVLVTDEAGVSFWVVNPIAFLKAALHLPDLPALDVTTENGRRSLLVSVDGDGASSRAELRGSPLSVQVLLEQVLERYPIPTTVSFIEAELSPTGQSPGLSSQLESWARTIFRLPHVEPASHSFSHPFRYTESSRNALTLEPFTVEGAKPVFEPEREIRGSVAYFNRRLLPPEKPVRMFLWPGEALPTEASLKLINQLGLRSINGGNTAVTKEALTLTRISPMGRPVGPYFQVYAAVQNEMAFTRSWTGPFDGYRRVIDTFEFTDRPYRLKPLHIYYHFYSATKALGLRALQDVYEWVLRQNPNPLWVSQYVERATSFQHASLSRDLHGTLFVKGHGTIPTLRLPAGLGWPDLDRSPGVAGMIDLPQGRYVHLSPTPVPQFRTTSDEPTVPFLHEANGRLLRWERKQEGIHFRIQGFLPLHFAIAHAGRACTVRMGGRTIPGVTVGAISHFNLREKDTHEAILSCTKA